MKENNRQIIKDSMRMMAAEARCEECLKSFPDYGHEPKRDWTSIGNIIDDKRIETGVATKQRLKNIALQNKKKKRLACWPPHRKMLTSISVLINRTYYYKKKGL